MSRIPALLEIMARLRDPEEGCPWDLEQSHASISPHTIEEAYEVDEAIREGDPEALRDELGDLLFQVVFQARIAEEAGTFDFEGVVEAITSKLVRRHPHIFADGERPKNSAGQLASWEEIKAAERAASAGKDSGPPDPFQGIPRNLPALARSAKIAGRIARMNSGKAGKTGRPAASLEDVARVEIDAARDAVAASAPSDQQRRIGAGLRAWVHLARAWGIDPEQALRELDEEEVQGVRERARPAGSAKPTVPATPGKG
ncbi:MAG: nucleoside triphosphate pyrophosphohydrolase [Myxococcota bacterium]